MIKIKIKKVYTFWWKTLICAALPETVVDYNGFGRPTIAFKLTTGEYLYIGAERIKEMRCLPRQGYQRGRPWDYGSRRK